MASVARSELGNDALHLGELENNLLDLGADGGGFRNGDAGYLPGFNQDGSLIQPRHELRSDEAQGAERDRHDGCSQRQSGATMPKHKTDKSLIAPAERSEQKLPVRPERLSENQRRGRRNHRQGDDERAQNGRADRHRHGTEHATFESLERKNRKIHRNDNRDPEQDRSGDFVRRGSNGLTRSPSRLAGMMKTPHEIFHHDHGTVHDQSEIYGAQTHQVCRNPEGFHSVTSL